MKTIILSIFFTIPLFNIAQSTYILEKNDGTDLRTYTNFTEAREALEENDIFYLPGGVHDLGGEEWIISASNVQIIGAGYHPHYTEATGICKLINPEEASNLIDLAIEIISENVVITGIETDGRITINTGANSITLKRNYLRSIDIAAGANNIEITENIIRSMGSGTSSYCLNGSGDYDLNCLVFANYLEGRISNFKGPKCVFMNNNILQTQGLSGSSWVGTLRGLDQCYFYRNIFEGTGPDGLGLLLSSGLADPSQNLVFESNSIGSDIFNGDTPDNNAFYEYGSNLFYNTSFLVDFVNVPSFNVYNFDYDYQVADGFNQNLGIFGGGWKEGGLPDNPHYDSINIDSATNQSGQLGIEIQVTGQSE